MNTPNPLIPQGSLPNTRGKNQIRIAVITILAIHVVLLLALLMAGCKKTNEQAKNDGFADTGALPPPSFDPNALPPVATNPPTPAPAAVTPTPPVAVTTSIPPVIPTPVAPAVVPPSSFAGEGTEHTIMKGDSFFTLGKKYNTSARAIASVNPGVDSTKLKIGQKVKIPPPNSSTPATPAGNGGSFASNGGDKVYAVKSGDNLNRIAKANGVSVTALRTANNLKTDQIKVGQKLKIPTKGSGPAETSTLTAPNVGGTNTQ
jgi:LysM repeat protein